MLEATVNGVSLTYGVIGERGPWIALNPGSRRNYSELLEISRKLASGGYRVLLHDRRNCGASEVAFDGRAAEYEIWADDLHELDEEEWKAQEDRLAATFLAFLERSEREGQSNTGKTDAAAVG